MERNIKIKQHYLDKFFSVLLVGLCVYMYFAIKEFSAYGAVFPRYINMILSVLAVVYFAKSWIFPLQKESYKEAVTSLIENHLSFLIVFPITVLYVFFLIGNVGFLVSSVIYTFIVIFLIKRARNELSQKLIFNYFLFSLVFNVLVYYVFRHLLAIRLPTGIFI